MRKVKKKKMEDGEIKMKDGGTVSMEKEDILRTENEDISRPKYNRKIKTFRVCSAIDELNRHRCSGNTLAELECNIRKEFRFGKDDDIELRNKSDGTKIGSDKALALREDSEFLVVINKTKDEDYCDPEITGVSDCKKRKLEPAVINNVNNVYNIQKTYVIKKTNVVQIGGRNKQKNKRKTKKKNEEKEQKEK